MTIYIYGLFTPGSSEPSYIGRAVNPSARIHGHLAKSAATRVRAWVESLGCDPEMRIIRECANEQEARIAERAEIASARLRGVSLLNSTWGGERARQRKAAPPAGFGARLRSRRHALGMSIDDLSAAAQVDRPRISRMEHDQRGPSAWCLVQLARALETSAEWLLTGEGVSHQKASA